MNFNTVRQSDTYDRTVFL